METPDREGCPVSSRNPSPKLVAQSIEALTKAIGGTISHVNASPSVKAYLSTIGTKGGKAKSDAKTISSQRNAKLGGGPLVNPSAEDLSEIAKELRESAETLSDCDTPMWVDAEMMGRYRRVALYLERKAAKRAAGKQI